MSLSKTLFSLLSSTQEDRKKQRTAALANCMFAQAHLNHLQGTKIFQYCTCPAGRVTYTGFVQTSISKIQGLLKASPAVFKDYVLMTNIDLRVKSLLQKC